MPKILKIAYFTILTSLFFIQNGYCVPALDSVRQIEQPDGTTFTAKLWGDERAHGWETLDGYTVVKDPATKYWHYARIDKTTQALTADLAVGSSRLAASFEKHQRPAAIPSGRDYQSSAFQSGPQAAERTPITGTRPVPVMMINFNNTTATFDAVDFDHLLFGSGNGSMKDYYEEVSYGAFSLSSGSAGVTGWYTADNASTYYGANDAYGYDRHPGELVIETVAAADASIDFSEYDSDGDCYVDAVVIVHQGAGEEAGGGSDTIWSHRWSLSSAAYYGDGSGQYITNDTAACGAVKINDYVIQPETLYGDIQTVGVFAHEYGHVLGLPDLYDVDYSSNGIGKWGLMSSGAWGMVSRPGDSPVHMSAWSKYVLGWVEPVTVTDTRTDEEIDPAGTSDDVYRFFPNRQSDGQEYYLIENRQLAGFDAGLPGTGLAIWHIDEDKATYNNRDNSQECLPEADCTNAHYRVALIQADGYADLENRYNSGDSGDLYPGVSGNTAFNSTTDPGSQRYDGAESQIDISNIAETGDTVTATLGFNYFITPSASGSGQITPGRATAITQGGGATFTITPDEGFEIINVYVDDEPMGAVTQYTFSDTQEDHRIRAEFSSPSGTSSGAGSSGSGGGGGSGGCFVSAMINQAHR